MLEYALSDVLPRVEKQLEENTGALNALKVHYENWERRWFACKWIARKAGKLVAAPGAACGLLYALLHALRVF